MSYTSASKKAIFVLSLALGSFAASHRVGYPRLTASALASQAPSLRSGARSSHGGSQLDEDVETVWGPLGGVRKHADKSGHGHELNAAGDSFLHNEDLIKVGDQETEAHVRAAEAKRVHQLAQAKIAGKKIREGYSANNLSLGSQAAFRKEQEKSVLSKVEKERKKAEALRDERDNREKEACDKYFTDVTKSTTRRLAPKVAIKAETLAKINPPSIGEMINHEHHGQIWDPRPLTRAEFDTIFGKEKMAIEDLEEYPILLASGEMGKVFKACFKKEMVYNNEYAEPAADFFWRRAPAYFQVEGPRAKMIAAGADAVDRKVAATLHRQAHQQDMKIDAAGASAHVHVRLIQLKGDDEPQPTTHSHFMKEVKALRIEENKWAEAKGSLPEGSKAEVAHMQAGRDREAAYDLKHKELHKTKKAAINVAALKSKQDRLQSALDLAAKAVADVQKAIAKAGADVPELLTEKLTKKQAALATAQQNLDEVKAQLAAAAP